MLTEQLKTEIPALEKINARKEVVNIPGVGEFLILTPGSGETVNFKGVLDEEHYTGPKEFAFVVASPVYHSLRGELPVEERWSEEEKPREVRVIVYEQPHRPWILRNLPKLSAAANFFYAASHQKDKAWWHSQYEQTAVWILQEVARATNLNRKGEIVPIVRAGEQLAKIGNIPYRRVLEEKRFKLVGEEEILCAGITRETYTALDETLSGKTVVPLEVIQASGSTLNTLAFALAHKEIRPESINVVALVGVQQGVDLYLKVAKHLGFKTRVELAGLGYSLDNRWYATASNEDELSKQIQILTSKPIPEIQLVGDAGDLLSPLE